MNKPLCLSNALVLADSASDIDDLDVRQLSGYEMSTPWPEDDAERVEAIFATHPPPNVAAFKNLRWVQIESAGYSHLFQHRFGERGVTVTNARGLFDCPIAEWNLAMMINLARDVRGLIRNQDAKVWDRSAKFTGEIRGRTLGIWGYGGIGRETARLAKAFGMKVHVLARSIGKSRADSTSIPGTGDPDGSLPDRYFSEDERFEFLRGLDYLILAMPLTTKTGGIVGEVELRALRQGAFVLNPARGPLIQEQALIGVLQDGHLGGAALDTHYAYPLPPEHPLWAFRHVILTPHISGTTHSPLFQSGMLDIFLQNARLFARGEPLLNVIAPADLQ